ncbi:hypothetical protein A3D78_05300 [Candidatus Gottesmanbacteria bacterium RIFCSPHIGHO2_02_FULL_39_14]|uniref:CopG-like ribbon-helix-helix domain-containing protein n=3 Tax=Candidatus Gottesmaniibacteriota TaxID=1752720 RepID=A0A1F5ZYW1_9BACT|nr:MAG: hypothetical protein A2153_03030 [Candidatus Gottesmanbacteria bacterium RBG_16_38_7b]OGG17641.1 MAG: hypothetical protein A3D78_05300 [Candidatus Gottesmanbacteria bacterium RIFCSPHIGHO2_02_FULL_39_14]OGG32031.1 MAG: hypothetical protein A3I51_01820 [Candidatus Gottesmanbacteria bacterium RIFCSPLOWO2_02_FULL_38_8]
MIRTQVYLPEIFYQEVKIEAKKENKATAQVIRELLEEGLNIKRQKNNIGKALLTLTSIKAKGPKDLSTKIDKYLYE